MPPSIRYKDLPSQHDRCGESAHNAAVFLREGIQSIDPNQDGILSPQEISGIGLPRAGFEKRLNAFKKNYLQLKSDKCDTPQPKLQKLFQQGELLLKDLGFKCKVGFWSCSRPSVSAKNTKGSQAIDVTPSSSAVPSTDSETGSFKSKDDLENALYDQEIFKEKYSLFDAKRNDRDGYFPINLALIEVRKFLLQESDGNAALAVSQIREWLSIPALRNDRGIPNHARKKLRDILLRIPPKEDEVYNRGVKAILNAVKAYYGSNPLKITKLSSTASIPVVITSPRRSRIASEFEFSFFPSTHKARVDTLQKFQRTYAKHIRQSLSTAFLIKVLKAEMRVSIEPINGSFKKVVFTGVQAEGEELDQKLVQSVLRGIAEKLRVNYRFKDGVKNLTETIAFSRVLSNDSVRR